ncbi:eukaryotic translation initiation factor 3 subunit J [Hyaloraphidium curvatum]|nr:eukaryotic translation initiation factor 3 subunit J [Hyaloraphidium curvatum]
MDDWESEDVNEIPAPKASAAAPPPRLAAPPKKGKWDDEDKEEDVKESWEESEDEAPKPAAKPVGAGAPKKAPATAAAKKGSAAAKSGAKAAPPDEPEDETPEERKRRLRKLETDADFENVQDLFANVKFTSILGEDGEPVDLGSYKPAAREEFDLLAKAVVQSFARFEKHGLYVHFVETLSRELATTLADPLDVKKVASTLTALANEKQKVIKEKESKKKKAPAKKSLNRSEDIYDDVATEGGGVGGAYDDEFDFM